jgi:serine/threonine protein kinase
MRGVVYKAIKLQDKTMDHLKREVRTLKAREHRNIIRLLSSFETGRVFPLNDKDRDLHLYMIFPRADGDMKRWMEDGRRYTGAEDDFCRFMYATMRDLVSGLAYIHRHIDGQHAHHHDIKPANILWFDIEKKYPIWKICDFGNANLKKDGQASGTQHVDSTYIYEPPERSFPNKEKRHGRAYDIWSLGCVLLELATIFTFGWEAKGLPEFVNRRKKDNAYAYGQHFSHRTGDISFFNNMGAVRLWMENLRGSNTDPTFPNVLALIEEMLNEKRDDRVFAWEIEMDLYEILDHPGEKELREKLKGLLQFYQPSKNRRNPLARAKEKRKPAWWQQMLRNHTSVNDTHEAGEQSDERAGSAERSFSTLELMTRFNGCTHCGRHDMNYKIMKHFKHSTSVGLWGFWGIGYASTMPYSMSSLMNELRKSFLAYRYASHYRETKPKDRKNYTFWADAESPDTFRSGYQDIAKKSESKPMRHGPR